MNSVCELSRIYSNDGFGIATSVTAAESRTASPLHLAESATEAGVIVDLPHERVKIF